MPSPTKSSGTTRHQRLLVRSATSARHPRRPSTHPPVSVSAAASAAGARQRRQVDPRLIIAAGPRQESIPASGRRNDAMLRRAEVSSSSAVISSRLRMRRNVPISPCLAVVVVGLVVCQVLFTRDADAHGRLVEPPSRSSAWRYNFPTPPNYNDHELYCGGFSRQWQKNGGKCGICGDAWDLPPPRPNEAGGRYGTGVIVRKLAKNGPIRIKVELTANHAGFFEFRLCPHNNPKTTASQRCFDKYLLQRMDGEGARYFPTPGRSEVFSIDYQLPKDVVCTQCILQWRYVAGNNWGMCKNGTGMLGCGPQEEFRACADVAISGDGPVTTFDEDTGEEEQEIPRPKPPTHDEGEEDYNEVDSDFNRGDADADEVFNPAERVAAIVCGFLLTSLVLAAAIGLSYLGKKRIREYISRWTPPSVASSWSTGTAWVKKNVPFSFGGGGGGAGKTKKPPLPPSAIYGSPTAAINAALERGEKPQPMAPVRKHQHHGVAADGFTTVNLTAPGLSFNPAPPVYAKPSAPPLAAATAAAAPVTRPSEAPPPPPCRPPRQRSPKRQLSNEGNQQHQAPPPPPSLPPPEDASITVNGVALPE